MTALHQALQGVFDRCGDVTAVALPKERDITYEAFGQMIRGVQSTISDKAPRAIGILSTRSLEAYIAVLAAFFSGVRFVPLNPELPPSRLQKIIHHGQVDLVLHDGKRADIDTIASGITCDIAQLAGQGGTGDMPVLNAGIEMSDIAYQMFTSGSTGEPKGVPITYGNLACYVDGIRAVTGAHQGGRFSQLFDLSFDLSMHDIFVGLTNGGTLVPASAVDLMMPHSYIQKKRIEYWFSVPLIASVALRGQADKTVDHRLKEALFCGEQLPTDYAAGFMSFVEPGGALYNLYGPTEATIAFTAKKFDAGQLDVAVVPLGEPFGQNSIAALTEDGEVVPVEEGVEGELLLGGPQVFDGYVPANTSQCFSDTDPRFYRSGDLVRMSGGELHHLGRTDTQIKLRGYRIELGDIEAAFRKAFDCPATAAVVLGEGEARHIGLAYQAVHDIADMFALSEHLPPYMIPACLLRLDALPTNLNGKIDRKAIRTMTWPG